VELLCKQQKAGSRGIASLVSAAVAIFASMAFAVPASADPTELLSIPTAPSEAPAPVETAAAAPVEMLEAAPVDETVEAPPVEAAEPAPAETLQAAPIEASEAPRPAPEAAEAEEEPAATETVAAIAEAGARAGVRPDAAVGQIAAQVETARIALHAATAGQPLAEIATSPIKVATAPIGKTLNLALPRVADELLPTGAEGRPGQAAASSELDRPNSAESSSSSAGPGPAADRLAPRPDNQVLILVRTSPASSFADWIGGIGASENEGLASPAQDLAGSSFGSALAATETRLGSLAGHPANDSPSDRPAAPSQSLGASAGSGSSFFVPLAALLALLALAAPATFRRLREVPAFRPPTPFVCALERPG
jgi:hypothetical protein